MWSRGPSSLPRQVSPESDTGGAPTMRDVPARNRTIAMTRPTGLRNAGIVALGVLGAVVLATGLRAESQAEPSMTKSEAVIKSHGFSHYGDLDYPEGF